jgi:sulfur relay protein TusB/DsrH
MPTPEINCKEDPMLFLIASAPDTKEFKTAYRTAKGMKGKVCLLQNAVYAARNSDNNNLYFMRDDAMLRGISEDEISGKPIDYGQLVDLMTGSDKVLGLF